MQQGEDGPNALAVVPQLTFVTVAFESELPLLALQARSMAVFLPDTLVAAIIVIDNTDRGMSPGRRRRLLRHYGRLGPLVRVLRPDEISPGLPTTSGWVRQQILKLAIADVAVSTEFYVALDAKNHLLSSPSWDFFVSPDGRARVPVYSFVDHPLRQYLERVLDYTGLPRHHVDEFPSTVTPFVLETRRVSRLLNVVSQSAGRPFAIEFVEHDLTEFFLYSASIITNGESIEDVFDRSATRCPVVWPRQANADGVRAAAEEAQRGDLPFFSVHRRALLTLDRAGTTELAKFWTARGLFPSDGRGRWFVRGFRLGVLRTHALRKVATALETARKLTRGRRTA